MQAKKKPKPIYRADHKGPQAGIYKHNKAILTRTATKCALCGAPIDKSLKFPNPMSLSIDHIIPITSGGKSTLDNLQATHLICNKEKGTKILGLNKNEIQTQEKNNKSCPQFIDWRSYRATPKEGG